jgi:DNA-binding transcriptional ArsR family regulator
MGVRVGDLLFHGWQSLALLGGWSDTFVFRMAPTDGLPPADYAGVVRALAGPLRRLRPSASLWVQVGSNSSPEEISAGVVQMQNGQGEGVRGEPAGPAMGEAVWFREEVRHALRGLPRPVAVTGDRAQPQIWDFSFFPCVASRPYPRPPSAEPYLKKEEFRPSELTCLRVLARSDCAYTAEVASLSNLSRAGARAALRRLGERGLVALEEGGKYPLWKLRRPGLSRALRSWGLPAGRSFRRRRERGRDACEERLPGTRARGDGAGCRVRVTFRSGGRVSFLARAHSLPAGRHRRTARLWPAWLRQAWPQAQVWAGWSEVSCGRSRPDALCWGRLDGCESLFWLEVERGNASRERLRRRALYRLNRALIYARRCPARLVFALLGPRWVRQAVIGVFCDLPRDLAVVLADWKHFGDLPQPGWGKTRYEKR